MYIPIKRIVMLELGVSQAQANFTKLLNQTVVVVDKKSHLKKAVILPYEEYSSLVARAKGRDDVINGSFSKFVGILDSNFQTDDPKYRAIIK